MPPPRFKFIGCEILYREACYLAATSIPTIDLQFLPKGLHDLSRDAMQNKIQEAIDAVDSDRPCDAILLGYARCNDGLQGIRARNIPLVIPRAHDCITFFFGSRDAFLSDFNSFPGTYYMTTGWFERNVFEEGTYALPAYGMQGVMAKLGLADSFQEMVEQYGRENAEYILQSLGDWRKNYSRMLYLQMGIADESSLIEETRSEAESRGWKFDLQKGSLGLLQKLFAGSWDDDYVIVRPGQQIVVRNDEAILEAAPIPDDDPASSPLESN